MKLNKSIFTISILSLIVAFTSLYFSWQNKGPRIVEIPVPFASEIENRSTTTSTVLESSKEEWLLYENTKYGYKFSYPSNGLLQKTAEMEPDALNESVDIDLGIPGYKTLLQVSIKPFNTFTTSEDTGDNPITLKSFAENVHENQKKSTNPNFKDKQVGSLTKIVFAGEEAYIFALNGHFTSPSGGYLITGMHNYVITEHGGAKFIIHYPINDTIAQEVIDSFEFIQ